MRVRGRSRIGHVHCSACGQHRVPHENQAGLGNRRRVTGVASSAPPQACSGVCGRQCSCCHHGMNLRTFLFRRPLRPRCDGKTARLSPNTTIRPSGDLVPPVAVQQRGTGRAQEDGGEPARGSDPTSEAPGISSVLVRQPSTLSYIGAIGRTNTTENDHPLAASR